MEGKADMLLANRTLSALIVACLLFSGFAGFLFLADAPAAKAQSGDLVVTGTYTIEDTVLPVDGNVIINSGGNLIVRNATLSVISNQNPSDRHSVTVNSGGTLTLNHGTVTTYLDQIDPWPYLTMNVNGGTVLASGSSVLQFPGSIILTANAQVTLDDTTVIALPSAEVQKYVVGGAIAMTDQADDGPTITMTDSTLKLIDSSIPNLPEYLTYGQSASNFTLNGNSNLLAVNSYISIDYGPLTGTASDWYTHNVLDLRGLSKAFLYGCWIDTQYVGDLADRAPAIVTYLTGGASAIPSTKGAADNTGEPISDLATIDALMYDVDVGQTMEIDTWSLAYADAQPVADAVLSMTYTASPTYTGSIAVQWAVQGGSYTASTIIPVPPGATSTFNLPMASILTAGDIRNMNLRYSPVGGSGTVAFDQARITFDVGSDAFVYRWLNASVGDEYGVPIVGASISAKHTGITSLEGRDAFYYTSSGVSATPPTEVLTFLGKTAGTYLTTDADGVAVIPYMTDMLVNGMATNALFVGSYSLTGSAVIGGGPHSSTSPFAFVAYPAMEHGDQSAEHTVKILGVSAESPNPSRWLVVPVNPTTPNLAIEDMTYYHAGDVIVAAGGTLWVNNSDFQLVQAFPNQRQIYVDGTLASMAKLILNGATLISAMPVDIIVQGNGVLMATDTILQGVNIVALEDAQVTFRNVTMDGTITTSFDSRAVLSIYDSDLTQPVTVSGQAIGGFTNTSVPAIVAEDDAVAYIYRWIHVTVYDGNGYPLPGATVSARYFVNGTPAASGVSDSMGVARVSSTGTVITSTGWTFVGNYRVNTSLSHAGDTYYGDEFSVGVMPYTEPLGKNATFATVTIPGALPDLVLLPGALVADPASPMNHQWTYLNLTVSNIGPAPAHNVFADFTDTTETGASDIGQGFVSLVPVDGTAVMTLLWQAHEPLAGLGTHNITANLDADNLIPELDDSPEIAYVVIVVQNLPDLEVRSESSEIWTIPSSVVQNVAVDLMANVHNIGDATVIGIPVEFLDGGTLIGSTTTDSISKDGVDVVSVIWTPTTAGQHIITVRVNNGSAGPHDPVEISYSNNEASWAFNVLTPPNLVVSGVQFSPTVSVPGGEQLIIRATLTNTEYAPVTYTTVNLYKDSLSSDPLATWYLTTPLIRSSTTVEFTWLTPDVEGNTPMTFYVLANPTNSTPAELTYSDNYAFSTITVLDMRPDLYIAASRISFINPTTGEDAINLTYGKTVKVVALIENLGGRPANNITITMGYRNDSYVSNGTFTLSPTNYTINATTGDRTVNVTFVWQIMLIEWGWYDIWVNIDPGNELPEKEKGNNFAYGLLEVKPLEVDISINPDKNEYTAGNLMSITATVYYKGTFDPVPFVPEVVFMLEDSGNNVVPDSETDPVDGTNAGLVSQTLLIPTDLDSGTYEVVATILGLPVTTINPASASVQVTALGGGGLFPMWVWYIIIIVVVAAVAGFTVYTYKYGLGKYVECGECGAFIPAASKRCPKCGVEFEAGTMKCSECGAWIPAESTECPNCGVKFVGELEEEGDYLERMRKEYDEMVSKYRELAKPELGKKYSDKAFDEWWRRQPGYITFDDWLAKEEEKKKEGPIPCPVCGTLNPKEATVCHKCGTVFGAVKAGVPPRAPPPAAPPAAGAPPEGTYEAAAPGAAPRMVIRRPIEKKVVPKKIIRTPSGQVIEEEPKEGENNQ